MQLRPLTLANKPLFDEYTRHMDIGLSGYAFAALYIWREHFEFYWTLLHNYFCVFAKQNDDYFMPLLPLSKENVVGDSAYRNLVHEVYQFMLETNRNPHIARIENVPHEMLAVLGIKTDTGAGTHPNKRFHASLKETEYLYYTEALAQLKGNRYKSQRHAYNVFVANYPSTILKSYCPADLGECLALYDTWYSERAKQYDDAIYQAMLQDSRCAHRIGITHANSLGLRGNVVYIDGQLKGYTFGYPLTQDIFCVMFEITDLKVKGLAQFLYREFARCLQTGIYENHLCLRTFTPKWINAMGDAGLENLKRVKRSYHPVRLIPSYNVSIPGTESELIA